MFCCHCGKELPDNSEFCSYCGRKLSGTLSSSGAAFKSKSKQVDLSELRINKLIYDSMVETYDDKFFMWGWLAHWMSCAAATIPFTVVLPFSIANRNPNNQDGVFVLFGGIILTIPLMIFFHFISHVMADSGSFTLGAILLIVRHSCAGLLIGVALVAVLAFCGCPDSYLDVALIVSIIIGLLYGIGRVRKLKKAIDELEKLRKAGKL